MRDFLAIKVWERTDVTPEPRSRIRDVPGLATDKAIAEACELSMSAHGVPEYQRSIGAAITSVEVIGEVEFPYGMEATYAAKEGQE